MLFLYIKHSRLLSLLDCLDNEDLQECIVRPSVKKAFVETGLIKLVTIEDRCIPDARYSRHGRTFDKEACRCNPGPTCLQSLDEKIGRGRYTFV